MNDENSAPLISIIIPTYNRTRFLWETLKTVFDQTYLHFEVIIIDDGSNSSVHNVAMTIEKHPVKDRIRLFRNEKNQGIAQSRARGLHKARGEYIVFLDDDDVLHPSFLSTMITAFRKHPDIDIAVCESNVLSKPDQMKDKAFFFRSNQLALSNKKLKKLKEQDLTFFFLYGPAGHSFMYKREVLEELAVPNCLKVCDDTFRWLSLVHGGSRFHIIRRELAYYRVHERNISSAGDRPRKRLVFLGK